MINTICHRVKTQVSVSGATSETYLYKEWGNIQSIPVPNDVSYLTYHTAVVYGGKVYTFGGGTYSYVYDGNWSIQEGLMQNKIRHTSIVMGDSIYHIGGSGDDFKDGTTSVEKWTNENGNFIKKIKVFSDKHYGGRHHTLS